MEQFEETVAVVQKSAREHIRVRLHEHKPETLVDIRVFRSPDGATWQRTRQGFAVPRGKLLLLLAGLAEAAYFLNEASGRRQNLPGDVFTAEEDAILNRLLDGEEVDKADLT